MEQNYVTDNLRIQLQDTVKQVRVQQYPLAVNTALPAFAAERRAAARATAAQLQATRLCQSCSSAVAKGQTDRQTDAWQLHRPCSTYYASSANKNGARKRVIHVLQKAGVKRYHYKILDTFTH